MIIVMYRGNPHGITMIYHSNVFFKIMRKWPSGQYFSVILCDCTILTNHDGCRRNSLKVRIEIFKKIKFS